MRTVAFAIPSLTHSVSIEFLMSVMRTDWLLSQAGVQRTYLTVCGKQFIANARCELVHDFLVNHPDYDDFFFLDDDLGWDPEAALRMLERDEDIIAGVYPKRQDEPEWPVMLAGHGGKLHTRDHLIRALRVPTGFMRIKRRVLEEMTKHASKYKEMGTNGEVKEIPAVFSLGVDADGWFWTEDYIFSVNADALGFEIWVDPDIEFFHRGPKAWTGNLKTTLPTFRKRAREAHKARKAAEREMAATVRSDAA